MDSKLSKIMTKMNIPDKKAETEVSALMYKMIIMKKHYGAKDSLFGISQLWYTEQWVFSRGLNKFYKFVFSRTAIEYS